MFCPLGLVLTLPEVGGWLGNQGFPAVDHWLFLHVEIGPRELVLLRCNEFIETLCLVCHGIGVLSFSWL